MTSFTRRVALKLLGIGSAWLGWGRRSQADDAAANDAGDEFTQIDRWNTTHDRVWLGENFWANPMEDWRIVDGAAECQTSGGDRNIQLLTHQLTNPTGTFEMSVQLSRVEVHEVDGGAGFRIGTRSDINEHRSNCFAKNGLNAGIIEGQLALAGMRTPLPEGFDFSNVVLHLAGHPSGEQYELTLTATSFHNSETITRTIPAQQVLGNVALTCNYDAMIQKGKGARYRFHDWFVAGDAFTVTPAHKFGPILWSMYTLSDSRGEEGFVLKISALTGPLGEEDNHAIELQVQREGQWHSLGESQLDPDAWVATFRIPYWNETIATPYRLVYREAHTDGSESEFDWSGVIKANPTGRPLRLGALTCQNDYGFPYEPVANNLQRLDPDMLYFSGDQIYENHGGYGLIRDPAEPAILNYLRKFYQFGWSFRESMKDRPTVCIPDDHDVFQGNIWGEEGKQMEPAEDGGASSSGGYREPARMVNVVHKTCAGHHPDYFDPTPALQDISVYYGDMVYGGVSFAILGDRQFKSGPEHVDTGSGRADHVTDPDFDCSTLDPPGLQLLGDRQEEFLRHWSHDWRGHSMKVLLSQTVWAAVATHHGSHDGYLKADLDAGGWPHTARNNAVRIIRDSKALHINGDQHLTTLCQYGVDSQRDANWSFCTPAIAAGYPRWWRPDEVGIPHEHRPSHGLAHTGEFIDSFGNPVYVYAVGNPDEPGQGTRYERAHGKGSGFGLVTIDPQARTYLIESFRFLIDATDGNPANQFPGWPVTIHQDENAGENLIG